MRSLSFLLIMVSLCACSSPEFRPGVPVIPVPAEVGSSTGGFTLTADTGILVLHEAFREEAERFALGLRPATGFRIPVQTPSEAGEGGQSRAGSIRIEHTPDLGAEAYALDVAPEGVTIRASRAAGVFYAVQTFRQLLPPEIEYGGPVRGPIDWTIPGVDIRDEPRFSWRGLHLDVGRHFFDVAFVKEYIDTMARFKLNRFHWHLTEDQGWRIEVKQYPRLTDIGAWRDETILEKNFDPFVGDGEPHGGFYSQDDIREIVAHAAERHVTIVPEIEMPGHARAALAAYPELACTDDPLSVSTVWGVHEDIFCPSEATFTFLENVLTEVMELFPGEYIHIGGDEVPKVRWENSELAQEVMEREGLANETQLQSWFIHRIERFLDANGRRLIGWDEILEGGIAPGAAVMSWRGMEGGIAAARQGHDVVMSPTSHLYFDYYQGDPALEPLAIGGDVPLEKVYAFEPIPDSLTTEEARHVLGAQGNVWTEYIKSPEYVEYMAYPRALALAEVVWSPASMRDWTAFKDRLRAVLPHLESRGVNYRIPDFVEDPAGDGLAAAGIQKASTSW